MFLFNPKVVIIDFSKALRNALTTENLFTSKPIVIHCFFHFVQNNYYELFNNTVFLVAIPAPKIQFLRFLRE
jgi:hypothetical protein